MSTDLPPRPRRRILFWYLAAVALAVGPVLLAMAAGAVGSALGCPVTEAEARPCALGPFDVGGALYQLGVLGWLGLVTVPLGLAAVVVGTVYLLLTRRRRR